MRSALVTGATRGIGRATALRLAQKGFGLTVAARSADALPGVAAELEHAGSPRVEHVAMNVGDRDVLDALVQRHAESFGAMSALVLNAGTGAVDRADEVDLRAHDRMVAVNLTSAMVLVRAAMPLLRAGADADRERGARVIAVSSITGVFPEAGLSAYGATKAALISFVEALDLENAEAGVLAHAIAPGYVDTDMVGWVTDRIPRETMIPVDDVVAIIDLLTELSRNTSIRRIAMTRATSTGFYA